MALSPCPKKQWLGVTVGGVRPAGRERPAYTRESPVEPGCGRGAYPLLRMRFSVFIVPAEHEYEPVPRARFELAATVVVRIQQGDFVLIEYASLWGKD